MTTLRMGCSLPEDPEPQTWVEIMWNRNDPDVCITVARGNDGEDNERVCFVPVGEFLEAALRVATSHRKRIAAIGKK